MSTDWIPRADWKAYMTLRTFANGIAANPGLYMVSAGDGTSLLSVVDAFGDALHLAEGPTSRNKGSVNAKNEARAVAESLCRRFYSLIKPNAGISDQAKININVRPENRGRQRINCPTSPPIIGFLTAQKNVHHLVFHDAFAPTTAAKPFGAVALELFIAIGDEPTTSVTDARYHGRYTRSRMMVELKSADGGRYATYFGRWVSRRGDTGPWSVPLSVRVM